MGKKSKWKVVAATDPYIMLSEEEKENYRKQKKEHERRMFKFGLALDRMPVNKPKFKKAPKRVEEDIDE